jgi:hypothetical protein
LPVRPDRLIISASSMSPRIVALTVDFQTVTLRVVANSVRHAEGAVMTVVLVALIVFFCGGVAVSVHGGRGLPHEVPALLGAGRGIRGDAAV